MMQLRRILLSCKNAMAMPDAAVSPEQSSTTRSVLFSSPPGVVKIDQAKA
jgi:hypothetical protein